MYTFASIIIIVVAFFLIIFVLVQNSKGGGLASNFSSSNQIMGVRKTTDFLEKATWTLAGALLILSFASVMVLPKNQGVSSSVIDEQINTLAPAPVYPSFPVAGEAPVAGESEILEIPAE